jgi:hypothetical protein
VPERAACGGAERRRLDALLKETRHTPDGHDDQDDSGTAGDLVPVA